MRPLSCNMSVQGHLDAWDMLHDCATSGDTVLFCSVDNDGWCIKSDEYVEMLLPGSIDVILLIVLNQMDFFFLCWVRFVFDDELFCVQDVDQRYRNGRLVHWSRQLCV